MTMTDDNGTTAGRLEEKAGGDSAGRVPEAWTSTRRRA
jgi:cyclopropane-fatty-acyl-phospholipid synthase